MSLEEIQAKISEQIHSHFESLINERKEYYQSNQKPTAEDTDSIVTKFCGINSAISFGSSILPAPLGLATIIPEIGATMSNHSKMVYDLCIAKGKEEQITTELLMTLTFQLTGGAIIIGIAEKQASKFIINKLSPKLMKQVCESFAIKITSNAAKSSVAKFIPVLGAAAFSAWATYTTYSIGNESIQVLNGTIQNTNIEISEFKDINKGDTTTDLTIEEEKIYVFLNLMKADEDIADVEQKFISDIIDSLDFGYFTKGKLSLQLHTSLKNDIDFAILNKMNKVEKETFFIDMVTLTKRDGVVQLKELEYILEVSNKIGFSDKEVFLLIGNDFNIAKILLSEKCGIVDETIMCSSDDKLKTAVLYSNNRIFLYNKNDLFSKGSYFEGGRKIQLDNGRSFYSKEVFNNIMSVFE